MSTTTIRLPEDLKERVLQTAERTGQSPHGFILQAIEEKTEREARRQELEHTAEQRYAQILVTGEILP